LGFSINLVELTITQPFSFLQIKTMDVDLCLTFSLEGYEYINYFS
jgi:hypothetical protein